MHRHVCSLALLAAVAAWFLLAATISDADRLETRDLAYEAMDVYSEDGFHIREELLLGKLGKGESYYFDTQLSANNEYFFYVGGDDTVYALQLRIYDENWELVTANIMHEPQAEVTYLTEWSGIYHVKVTMTDCEEHGGYWFLISGFK